MARRPAPDYPPRSQDMKRDFGLWWEMTTEFLGAAIMVGIFAVTVLGALYCLWYLLTH